MLLWIGISAFAVLVGAAVNAAIDRVWPSVATAAARAAQAPWSAAGRPRIPNHPGARDHDEEDAEEADEAGSDMPSEFPERWSRFLPPEDVTSRLRTRRPGDRQ